jgi:sulfite reductase (NADPH) flavoprotein alpha-component
MVFDRSHPFLAKIKERYPLTKTGSTKQTYHVSLDLTGADIPFKVGDSFGILPENHPKLVQSLIDRLKATGQEQVMDTRSGKTMSLRQFLTHKANLARSTSALFEVVSQGSAQIPKPYLESHGPDDLLAMVGEARLSLQQFCSSLAPLLPRFYSAASSPHVLQDEVHLNVSLSSYPHFSGQTRFGVASHFLCHSAKVGETAVPCYVQAASHFTLPQDHSAPIIMVGPGTGVAPFRGFMQERLAKGASGKNWLFFGERHRQYDFFYEDFWTPLAEKNLLRLDLAFSRDGAEKLYVQHKMYEQAHDLWTWLQDGAYFYVCGDATKMAKQVEATVVQIAHEKGGLDKEAAKAYVRSLRVQKRYLMDVY